jgi:microcystin-dependent protein
VSRTTHAALFAVIGTTYGVGDSSTTFNLPDLRGRIAVGSGSNPAVALGNSDNLAEPDRQPLHVHSLPPHSHGLGSLGVAGGGGGPVTIFYAVKSMEPCHNSGLGCSNVVGSVGGGTIPASIGSDVHAHGLGGRAGSSNNDGDAALSSAASAPSFVVVNYIIRAQ